MTNNVDHYQTLGVSKKASLEEIKRAYRRLAKKYHPDRNPDDPTAAARFKEVQKAYEILKDAEKRAQYDQFGEAAVGQWATNQRGQKVYQWGGGSSVSIDDIEDLMSAFGGGRHANIFDEIFGNSPRRKTGRRAAAPEPQRGTDVQQAVSLSLEDVLQGTTVSVRSQSSTSARLQTLDVKIPPGVDDGQKIRLKGRGGAGRNGGPAGDLLLVCSIRKHPYLQRQGPDLLVDVPVSITEAALGASIEVPSLEGPTTVTLPAGTPSGRKLRLVGKGLVKPDRSGRGDLYAMIKIVPPTDLTDEQRQLYEQLRNSDPIDPRRACRWWKG